ncbi:MAG: hypothetical protein Q4G59_10495, partial [Planctomycetia bacterium]|nr:hypothetical protein [Planctomycetia bacterium]
QCGLSQEWAQWYVYEYYCVKPNKCDFPLVSSQPVDQRIQCPNCYKLNDPESMVCSCGNPLKTQCPKCGQNVSTLDKVCQCGFAIGNMSNALIQIERARNQLAKGQLLEARQSLDQADIWWPGNPDAKSLRQTIVQREGEVEKQRLRISDIEGKIRDSIRRRYWYQAQKQLAELRAAEPNSAFLQQEGKRIEQVLNDTSSKIRNLSSITDPVKKMTMCEEMLSDVADCAEAQAIMSRIPLAPARNLKAVAATAGIILTWEESLSKLISGYAVVRKENGAPASLKDGTIIADDLQATTYTDSSGKPGVIYGYSVFAKREGATESVACSSALVQLISEVTQVRILPGNHSATIGWSQIPDAKGLVLTRWEGDKPSGTGTVVRLSNVKGHVDTGLENDVQYTWRVQTLYQDDTGKDVLTPGLYVSTVPRVPPKAIKDLQVTRFDDHTLEFHWTPNQQGNTYLFATKESQSANEGKADFTPLETLTERFGRAIDLTDKATGVYKLKIKTLGMRRFFVLTYKDGIAVYGNSVEIAMVSEVSNIYVETAGSDLQLTWTWPDGIDDVVILVRRDKPATGPDDRNGTKITLSRKQYDSKRAFICANSYKNCYFTIYSFISRNAAYSNGVTLFAGKLRFRYDMKITKKAFSRTKQAMLMFTTEGKDSYLPALVVRKDIGHPPLNRQCGEKLMDIAAQKSN